ncbi:SRPBCC family protein [Nocardia niigatensis]|uniref:SRPBCC family protein n=1 Tax=Nocardia niigatensis TaxID=209249 RepID=UPI0007C5D7A4|nr:SRPBCC domain-containing protein [Nocardia niigatensis]
MFYPHPPELVWCGITDPTLMEQWLLPSIGYEGAVVGTHFLFTVASRPPAEIACEVLAATPPEALTWSWMDMRGPDPVRWTVIWGLHAQGRGTRLTVTTTGFDITDKRQRMQRNNVERGWRNLLPKLAATLDRL